MSATEIWKILAITALIILVFFGRRKSYTLFGLFLGIVAGLIIALIYVFKGFPFSWSIIQKDAVTGILIGAVLDLFISLIKTDKT